MTYIQNIPHILNNGITHKNSPLANPDYRSIGDIRLITNRNSKILPNKKVLGDYIPFYFGPRTPMLYVIHKGFNNVSPVNQKEIVYCISSVQEILNHNLDFIFTNGHAVDGLTDFYKPSDVIKINEIIDFEAIKNKNWKNDSDIDLKRRKEAEFLIATDVPRSAVKGFAVYNEKAFEQMKNYNIDEKSIIIKQNYYF